MFRYQFQMYLAVSALAALAACGGGDKTDNTDSGTLVDSSTAVDSNTAVDSSVASDSSTATARDSGPAMMDAATALDSGPSDGSASGDSATVADATMGDAGRQVSEACLACELQNCNPFALAGETIPFYDNCYVDPATLFEMGPAAGGLFRDLCTAARECVARTNCGILDEGGGDLAPCYCGYVADPRTDITACFSVDSYTAVGPCRAEFEAAAGSTNPVAVTEALNALQTPLGAAQALWFCDSFVCSDECAPGPLPSFGDGGM